MMTIEEVEAGVCSGISEQLHALCIVGDHAHDAHIVDVIHNGQSDVFLATKE